MQKELIAPRSAPRSNRPQELLQDLFGDKDNLRQISIGQENNALLERAKNQIDDFDPQEKVTFLEETFAILSDPDPGYQTQRERALDVLGVMDLTSVAPKQLTEAYIQQVHNLWEDLNKDSDPYGEIHMLLAAGIIIAPFIPNNPSDERRIAQAWKRVALAFSGDDRQKILDDTQKIRRHIPTKALESDTNIASLVKEEVKSPRKDGEIQEERRLVKDLRVKGMDNMSIASELRMPRERVHQITHKLIKEGKIPKMKRGRKKKVE